MQIFDNTVFMLILIGGESNVNAIKLKQLNVISAGACLSPVRLVHYPSVSTLNNCRDVFIARLLL